jgi:hypothetical protein
MKRGGAPGLVREDAAEADVRAVATLSTTIVRVAATVVTVALALLLVQLAPDATGGALWWLLLKAFAVTAALNAALFWAPAARGWWRLVAAALMLPAALILAGLAGETIMKIVRGRPLYLPGAITAVGGTLVYAWAFWLLARRDGGLRRLIAFIRR